MNPKNEKHLCKAIVDLAIFLEFSDEDVIDPDRAVEAMEQLAAELQLMSESGRREMTMALRGLAAEYGDAVTDFVEKLPEALGIATFSPENEGN